MAPTIRTVASYSTHREYSIDFFGDELFVTVTPTASVISRWIDDVFYNNRPFSHPLVVGVGVQWTPFSYISETPLVTPPNNYYSGPPSGDYYVDPLPDSHHIDLMPNHYYAEPPSDDYYVDPHSASYDADLPPNRYYDDPPRYSYYTDPSPGDYYADGPPGSYYSDPPPDTLQLCVGNQCLIVQLSYCDQIPNDLRCFLTDSDYKFVGIWNSQDAWKLSRSRHRLEIGELHDIRHYVNDSEGRSLRCCSFEEIVEECLGYRHVKLEREISMSDWSVYNLYHDQILQASLDVYVCSKLGVCIRLWEHC